MNDQLDLAEERYYNLTEAFREAIYGGVSDSALDTLRFETGFLKEDFDQLIKEKEESK